MTAENLLDHLLDRKGIAMFSSNTIRFTSSTHQRSNDVSHRSRLLLGALFLAPMSSAALADLNFTQTFDGWFENKYAWAAQNETIVCRRSGDPNGTVKSVWARVVQKNGSKAGTAVFCTTMTKTSSGLTDRWSVAVPAGTICDEDFWDASVICVETVKCDRAGRIGHNSVPTPFGHLTMVDLPAGDLAVEEEETIRFVSMDPAHWNGGLVEAQGFDMAVYAYELPGQPPVILNHLDTLALSTFTYDSVDAFGTGQPFDQERLVILGIDLDSNWDIMPKISNGLDFFEWQLFPGGGILNTDQGQFFINRVQPLTKGWIPLCPADMNADGLLDFFDVSAFLAFFNDQNPEADFNGDGQFDFFDISLFLNFFTQDCP